MKLQKLTITIKDFDLMQDPAVKRLGELVSHSDQNHPHHVTESESQQKKGQPNASLV